MEEGRAARRDGGLRLLPRDGISRSAREPRDERIGEPSRGKLVAHLGDERVPGRAVEERLQVGGGDPVLPPRRGRVVAFPFVQCRQQRLGLACLAEQDQPGQLHVG